MGNRLRIMHISDLHLGDDYVLNMFRKRRWFRVPVNHELQNGLRASLLECAPDYLVISGDLVNKASTCTYKVARRYIMQLLKGTQFEDCSRVMFVPGNHDIKFARKESNDYRRLKHYRVFLGRMYPNGAEHRKVHCFVQDRIIFACLDSTLKTAWGIAEGEIGKSQLEWLDGQMQKLVNEYPDFDDFVKVAVVHHHCVPIAGLPPSAETSMGLLDEGDLLNVREKFRFSLVLHGHKHFPHFKTLPQKDSRVLNVVGAGSVTCSFADEQHGAGHTFDILEVDRDANLLLYRLFREGEHGDFASVGASEPLPLFSQAPAGYRIRKVRKVLQITETLKRNIFMRLYGMRIEQKDTRIVMFPIRVGTDCGTITAFTCTSDSVTLMDRRSGDPKLYLMEAHLHSPLEFGKDPLDISYDYTIEDATALTAADFMRLNPAEEKPEDGTEIDIMHPMAHLELEVMFPKGFRPATEIRASYMGSPLALEAATSSFDDVLGVLKLTIANPKIGSRIGLYWTLS